MENPTSNFTPDAPSLNIIRFQQNFGWGVFTPTRTDYALGRATFRERKKHIFESPYSFIIKLVLVLLSFLTLPILHRRRRFLSLFHFLELGYL